MRSRSSATALSVNVTSRIWPSSAPAEHEVDDAMLEEERLAGARRRLDDDEPIGRRRQRVGRATRVIGTPSGDGRTSTSGVTRRRRA